VELLTSGPPDAVTRNPDADELRRRADAVSRRAVLAADRQHARGRLSARERIDLLLDPGSFRELGAYVRDPAGAGSTDVDAVVTGHGQVHGRPVCVFAEDFTVLGGSLGEATGDKIIRVLELAERSGAAVVGIKDSAGGRIQEGVVAQAKYGEIFRRNVRLSGLQPQISLILGPCAGGAVYSPALTDFVVMVDQVSQMFVTGPAVLREALNEDVGAEELGGARTHTAVSGAAHHLAETEVDAVDYVRALLAHLVAGPVPAPAGPHRVRKYPDGDVRTVLTGVLDGGQLLEVHARYGRGVVAGFGRLGGRAVGVVGNQAGGALDLAAALKAARFVRTCDAYGLPVLTFVDLPGTDPDDLWSDPAALALPHAYAEATVPRLTVILGHAGGFGYVALGSRHLGADLCLAWPAARIAGESPFAAAARGVVDDVIEPADTRSRLLTALRLVGEGTAERLPRKHDNFFL
jgi:propionyl-CoA carboxylase beta chain